jgi:hypothetical protein
VFARATSTLHAAEASNKEVKQRPNSLTDKNEEGSRTYSSGSVQARSAVNLNGNSCSATRVPVPSSAEAASEGGRITAVGAQDPGGKSMQCCEIGSLPSCSDREPYTGVVTRKSAHAHSMRFVSRVAANGVQEWTQAYRLAATRRALRWRGSRDVAANGSGRTRQPTWNHTTSQQNMREKIVEKGNSAKAEG